MIRIGFNHFYTFFGIFNDMQYFLAFFGTRIYIDPITQDQYKPISKMNFSGARLMQTPLCAYHFIDTLLNYKTTLFDYIFVT